MDLTSLWALFLPLELTIEFCTIFLYHIISYLQARKKWIREKNKNSPLQIGRAVAPALTRSSWIRYKTRLRKSNVTETSFIVVRHPFERIVSAYRDKIERTHTKNYETDWYYKQYGKKIVKKYRQRALNTFGSDFFRYVISHMKYLMPQ